MPHIAFTLDQLAAIQAFPTSHRLALRSRVVLDWEELEEIVELYSRDPRDAAYTLAAAPGGVIELTSWPVGAWQVFATVEDTLAWVIEHETAMEQIALLTPATS